MKPEVKKSDFNYDLPEDRIARFPLPQRADSRLLVYKKGEMSDRIFKDLPQLLNPKDLLIYNNARVIPARLYFQRATGAEIEILLLEPVDPVNYDQVFGARFRVVWECMIGNLKKWKENEELGFRSDQHHLSARLISKEHRLVEFRWSGDFSFGELLETLGRLPIPPYLKREAVESDYREYQTIYARIRGSVAAPTAGLHFDNALLRELDQSGIVKTELTLHVGAGTFLPVKEENVVDHSMHREHFELTVESLQKLINAEKRIAVGTTSLRVLETLYWMGSEPNRFLRGEALPKLYPYEHDSDLRYEDALQNLLMAMHEQKLDRLLGATEIMILPQYQIRSVAVLITNFHLPESTLLMIIASAIGPAWRKLYEHALNNEYRFLSYGDSSLLFLD